MIGLLRTAGLLLIRGREDARDEWGERLARVTGCLDRLGAELERVTWRWP